MDKIHYEEMKRNFIALLRNSAIKERDIYLFGHCNATEILADLFLENGCHVKGILDNNKAKCGSVYREIPIILPNKMIMSGSSETIVCIAARAYEAMSKQLREMGYAGEIRKLVEYDSYAEYSLSEATIVKKRERLERGMQLLYRQKQKYPDYYRIYCPFSALGDVYYTMSYLPYFLRRKSVRKYAVFTIGRSCAEVAEIFGAEQAEALGQQEMDETVQAVLYTGDVSAFIPHQDRPYVVKLAKVLHVKKISLEMIYKYGVFGLDKKCVPYKPVNLRQYGLLEEIVPGKAVILSPYAKSVTNILQEYWQQIIKYYMEREYQIFTNVAYNEQELEGTKAIRVKLQELQSVVERAGTFIGIRSGLCDVIKEADCRKIALYPDCFYSDTKWKMEEIYHLDGFENIVVR